MPQAAVARALRALTSQCVVGVTVAPCEGDWPRMLLINVRCADLPMEQVMMCLVEKTAAHVV